MTSSLPLHRRHFAESILLKILEKRGIDVCPDCLHEIDPECCHCGSPVASHSWGDGHSPVPMGCTCGYHEADKMKGSLRDLISLTIFGGHL